MKYTKEQRKEIYLKAYNQISSGNTMFLCHSIREIIGNPKYEITNDLPEIFLFNPEHEFVFWWFFNEREARLFALLICIEMCN
jgi:hypothetical protein